MNVSLRIVRKVALIDRDSVELVDATHAVDAADLNQEIDGIVHRYDQSQTEIENHVLPKKKS